jgi:hypothetical protein
MTLRKLILPPSSVISNSSTCNEYMENYLVYKDQIEGFREVGETVKTVEKIAAASSISRLRQDMANIDAYQANIGRILTRLSLFHEVDRTSKT